METTRHREIFDRYYSYVYAIVYRVLRDCGRGAPAGRREHHSVQVVLSRPRSGMMYRNTPSPAASGVKLPELAPIVTNAALRLQPLASHFRPLKEEHP